MPRPVPPKLPSITLCIHCRFFINKGTVWYDQFCGATPREKATDPVTGCEGYRVVNDLGRASITDEPYAYARDVNDGQCPLYQRSHPY